MPKMKTTIFHLSDVHIGESGVLLEDFRNIIDSIEKKSRNSASPIVLITGDLTSEGLRDEFENFYSVIEGLSLPLVIVPGNHDERNYGTSIFEELFGDRFSTYETEHISMYAADSSEPDNDAGHVGRSKYHEIADFFRTAKEKVKIFALHHHLIPVPHTGREHNVVEDAGDMLGVLTRSRCSMVLNGHRHVPWMWRLNGMILYNTGTLLSKRIRGAHSQAYTRIEIEDTDAIFYLHEKIGDVSKFGEGQLLV